MPKKRNAIETTLNYDLYGHCVQCHENMITERVVDGKLLKMFSPWYSEIQFLLDDGSKMRVAFCMDCKKALTENDYKDVMATVLRGWVVEVNHMVDSNEKRYEKWDKKYADDFINRYRKKNIVIDTGNFSDDVLKDKLKEYKEKKGK